MHHMQRLEQDSEQLAFFEKAFVTMCLTLQEYRIFAVFLDIVVYKAVLVETRQLLEFFSSDLDIWAGEEFDRGPVVISG